MKILPLRSVEDAGWLQMRLKLWPDADASEHLDEMASFLAEPGKFAQFVIRDSGGVVLGFVEASIRSDYVNGTESSPVAFIEGLYVVPQARRRGLGRALVEAIEKWATSLGCRELASDAPIRNRTSRAVHRSLGFAETERVVYFNKRLK